jgi:hypothetical protein
MCNDAWLPVCRPPLVSPPLLHEAVPMFMALHGRRPPSGRPLAASLITSTQSPWAAKNAYVIMTGA